MGTPALKLIILDRDGVINHDSPDFIKSPAEWLPIPGSLEAIARLNQAGYRVVVASNQSGIAREYFDMTVLNAIHQKMHTLAQQVGAVQAEALGLPVAPVDQPQVEDLRRDLRMDGAGKRSGRCCRIRHIYTWIVR